MWLSFVIYVDAGAGDTYLALLDATAILQAAILFSLIYISFCAYDNEYYTEKKRGERKTESERERERERESACVLRNMLILMSSSLHCYGKYGLNIKLLLLLSFVLLLILSLLL